MPIRSKILLIASGSLSALLAVDRLALWMESRGWIYWRKVRTKGGGIAAGLSAMQTLVEPEVRHVIEERDSRQISEANRNTPGNPP